MNDALLTFLSAMTPLGELRLAIPLGLVKFGLPWPTVFALAVAGNIVPLPFLYLALRAAGDPLERARNPLGALLRWRTQQIRRRYGAGAARLDLLALVILVGIPLPLTGAWTGTLVVWALRIPPRRGLAGVVLGVFMAGAIVTALAFAGVEAFRRF